MLCTVMENYSRWTVRVAVYFSFSSLSYSSINHPEGLILLSLSLASASMTLTFVFVAFVSSLAWFLPHEFQMQNPEVEINLQRRREKNKRHPFLPHREARSLKKKGNRNSANTCWHYWFIVLTGAAVFALLIFGILLEFWLFFGGF